MNTKEKIFIKNVRCHIGVQLKGAVTTTPDYKRHRIVMERWPEGIHIIGDGVNTVVTYANIHSYDILEETKPEVKN